ncbi:TRAP-type C4-dicarboxylate transport system permease small subunit [Rhodopseudomonas julia]|uniref:TRAP transporter small permease protein n=1 Tax=Rhodopseudomonas julia TaxID=200617 RepID=A0ABU0C847_9BRAD|nr:TRAP transporter small permease [Rhodopseudomonas julia]MDQ0326644.1 TRAP-type C4-dicarboxylate transport system permease small subunit [Rhodopseudomonas julia]
MRKALDMLYDASAIAAALAIVAIAVLVSVQVLGRVADKALQFLGYPVYGFLIPSLAEICGFLLVAASFLALASTLRHGVHIRVNLLLQSVPEAAQRPLNALVLTAGTALCGFLAFQGVNLVLESYRFGEVSFGIIPIPLWIPQTAMAAGLVILTVALLDDLLVLLRGQVPVFAQHEGEDLVEGRE